MHPYVSIKPKIATRKEPCKKKEKENMMHNVVEEKRVEKNGMGVAYGRGGNGESEVEEAKEDKTAEQNVT